MDDLILEMRDIEILFPGVKALDKVNLFLRKGEVHALMGENGAGKSTLIKCLTGVYKEDGGTMLYGGKEISLSSPQHAMQIGISTVYQEVNLCPNLTVAENIFIGREPKKLGRIDWKTMNERSKSALKRFNIEIDVTRSLGSYSVAIQQMIAITRAVDVQANILILDEPTSSLDEQEVKQLFEVMRSLKAQGMAIVFITHFLDQVYEISDRITILRNGKLVGEYQVQELSKVELVNKMVGKELEDISAISRTLIPEEEKELLLEADEIGVKGSVENISLTFKTKDILGFAGLLGSGRTEVAQMLFGAAKLNSGAIKMKGEIVHLHSQAHAIAKRIAFCPEDRKRDGIIGDLTIRENIILALQSRQGMWKYISKAKQNEIADKYIKLLGIATPDAEKKIGELSGGNQQKVILARWLATEPELLILDEPTRGIDVGAKADIMKLTISLCESGMSVVFISSELEEVIRCSNRVAVMRDRKNVAMLDAEGLDQGSIISAIAGGEVS